MGNGTGEREATDKTWRQLRRVSSHRTSKPTDEAIRRAVGEIAATRGSAPHADALILAAVRLASKDMKTLADQVREIETDRYPGPPPHDPGS